MDTDQRFTRFIGPGIAVGILVGIAWFLARQHIPLPIDLRNAYQLLASFVTSGGLGYVFAQIYFALPPSLPNHEKALCFVCQEHPDILPENDPSKSPQIPQTRAERRLVVHYIWQVRVASQEAYENLNHDTARYAARRAALGSMLTGLVLGLVILVVLLIARSAPWSAYAKALSLLGTAIAVFIYLHCRLTRELERIVDWGIRDALNSPSSSAQSRQASAQ